MTRPEQPTQLDLELQINLGARHEDAAQRPTPDADEPDEVTEDDAPLPSSDEEAFVHEDIWSDPDI